MKKTFYYFGAYSASLVMALSAQGAGVLSVLGSSVAKGYFSSGSINNQLTNGSFLNSYAADLTTNQADNGWLVVNQSVAGDTTHLVINRFYTDEVPVHADEDLIGLSLGNEGLGGAANPQAIYNQFFTGITNLIAMSRANNILPLVAHQYPKDVYSAREYVYLKKMDLQLNTLNAPGVNFLGATDDGAGHWVNNAFINLGSGDGTHPSDAGHFEMFMTIVPSVFDAIKNGKPTPQWGNKMKFLRIAGDASQSAPLSLTPSLIMHSFSISFRVRSTTTGTVASVTLPSSSLHPTVEITATGLAYRGINGALNNSGVNGTNDTWHDIVVTHQYARGLTWFYVDGVLASTVTERLTPAGFVLGGHGNAVTRPGSPVQADYQNWFVHRSMLNAEEVEAQYQGNLQQASLELYGPLDDNAFTQGMTVTNRAQSYSVGSINGATTNYSSLAQSLTPPTSLLVSSNEIPATILKWTDPVAATEDAYYVERSVAGGAWTNISILAAHATGYTDSAVSFGINYQYRVSYSQAGQRSDYSVSPIIRLPSTNATDEAVLIDLGRHDGGQGAPTASPDVNGNYWNSWDGGSGGVVPNNVSLTGLITINNNPSAVTVTTMPTAIIWANNGYNSGGLLAPDSALLGAFAIGTATGDFYYFSGANGATGTLRLAGLDASRQYNLSMFGTRDTSSVRTSRYSVTDVNGLHTVDLQTSGAGAGSAAHPNANDRNIVTLTNLVPDASGQIDLAVSIVNGGFAYLGILKVTPLGSLLEFDQFPHSLDVAPGTSTSLVAHASSPAAVSYQWYFTNSPISGATSTNLLFPSISLADQGAYFVTASNSFGVVTSAVVNVTLGPPHVPRSSLLIDFSRDDGIQGQDTASPDMNGNYWNNMATTTGLAAQGLSVSGLVTVDNVPTTIGLTLTSDGWNNNGINNGGLLVSHYGLLGDFAINTATEDYFFVNGTLGTMRVSGLNPDQKYNLSMFGTRNTDVNTPRTTEYVVSDINGTHAVDLQTSGPGAGSTNQPFGNDETIVSLNDLVPDGAGNLDLSIYETSLGLAYIGILQITPAPTAEAVFLPPVKIPGGWQLQFNATAGVSYRVQRASEVVGPWSDLGSVMGSSNGVTTFDDTSAPDSHAFYRTVYP